MVLLGIPRVDDVAEFLALVDGECFGPLAFDAEERVFLGRGCLEQGRGEGVLFPGQPAPAAVLDFGGVPAGGLDVGVAVELDEGRAAVEAFDVQRGERDQVVLVEGVDVEDCVPDLLDYDCERPGHGGFLSVVALQVDAVLFIPDAICCDGWVVRDLLAD